MLEDDELDFDDFGELAEFEGQELTTEELEKQLAMEFDDLPIDSITTEKEPVTEKPVTSEPTKVEKEAVMEDLDEGEIVEESKPDTTAAPVTTTKDPEKKSDALDKPLESAPRPRYNNNNNNFNNNRYNQQYMMPMNMFPYPQFSNRIYVNPNFQGGQQQQMLAQQQQLVQQQRYMELEQQRLALLQQQKQLQQSKEVDLDQKRREAAEMMKRRRENNNNNNNQSSVKQQAGDKRKLESNHNDDRDVKRPDIVFRQSPAGGISIKGAAAAARENRPYTPPHQRNGNNIRDRLGSNSPRSNSPRTVENNNNRPSIIDRLSNNNRVQPQQPQQQKQAKSDNKPQQQQQQQQQKHYVPIVTGGKSNTLQLKGFKDQVSEQDLKKMTSGSPVKDLSIDQNDKSATLVFNTIEEAVTFRRKYNRYQIGDAYISVVFKK